jgi:two-component system, NtrC family, sensor kinase
VDAVEHRSSRLTRKLLVALNIGMLAVLSLSAAVRVYHEKAYFERDMRVDARSLGHILAVETRGAFERDGLEGARRVVRAADSAASGIRVRWVWLDAAGLDDGDRQALRTGEDVAVKRRIDGDERLLTYVPITTRDGRSGALELSESFSDQRRYIRTTFRDAIMAAAALMFVYSLIATAIGYRYIGRPTALLMEKVRRIGAGDLSRPLHLRQNDELADIAREINTMCDQLGAAREKARAETESRLQAMEQLRHADRLTTVGKLAAGIAHELGTPLNVVGGRAQMIVAGEAETSAEVSACARIVVEQTRRMTAIVRQLLDFSRARTTKKIETDAKAVVGQTVELLRAMASKRGAALSVDLGEAPLPANLDAALIQQALTNVMVNAIQAVGPDGRVSVRLRRAVARTPGFGGEVDCVRIEVQDTGPGMDPATQARIFEPFFTTKGVGEGTGLGLSVSFGIVRDHGGWIDVDSAPGRGATFSLYLPIAARAETAA